jgi:hypothetical protein
MAEKVKFTTTLDKKLLIDVKKRAIDLSQSVNEILEGLLKDWLKKH